MNWLTLVVMLCCCTTTATMRTYARFSSLSGGRGFSCCRLDVGRCVEDCGLQCVERLLGIMYLLGD